MPDGAPCPECGTEIAPSLLDCPRCRHLVHSEELKRLAADAERAAQSGDADSAVVSWRRALELLPADARQRDAVTAKIEELTPRLGASAKPSKPSSQSPWGKAAAGLGAIGLFLATKGKLLFGGLTKASTFLSMFATFGAYWTLWGWKFALGIVLCVYVHEMGHVAMLRRYGIKATAPMFIPGLGAFVRLKQYPATAIEDARVGLAGPIWGLAASVGCALLFLATDWGVLGALARINALINLFNLIPVWQLDGSRGFRSLTRFQRWLAAGAVAAAWYFTANPWLLLLLIFAVLRAFGKESSTKPDVVGLLQYVVLVGSLSALWMIRVPGEGDLP